MNDQDATDFLLIFVGMIIIAFFFGLGAILLDPGKIQNVFIYVATVFGFIGGVGAIITATTLSS